MIISSKHLAAFFHVHPLCHYPMSGQTPRLYLTVTSFLFFVLASFGLFRIAIASVGDQSQLFRRCIMVCANQHGCPSNAAQFAWWAREECFRCRQQCIWGTVERLKQRGQPVPQFHGKWPFLPVTARIGQTFIAIQEPASVLFSLLNVFTVWRMLQRIRSEVPLDWYCRDIWLKFAGIGILTWTASALFHCCDHWLTEMLDYSCALALILFTFYASLRFILPRWTPLNQQLFRPIGLGLAYFYVHYLHSMYSSPHFDYAFHIRCCVNLALLTGLLFLSWASWECQNGRARRSLGVLAVTFALGWFSASFDAFFDFPPFLWLIDAHALFHFFSIPVPLLWAEFVCREANGQGKHRSL